MAMQDELIFDEPLHPDRQREAIGLHCAGLEERIKSAPTRLQAEKVLTEVCDGFDQACESSIVRTYLKQHAHKLLLQYWFP
ncbi:MAG: hypothetical protein WEB62_02875 [Bacteroidota bacterium]